MMSSFLKPGIPIYICSETVSELVFANKDVRL